LLKGPYSLLPLQIVGDAHQHRDPPHPIEPLLCARTEGPCSRCRCHAAEQRDELAAFHLRGHSMTSSAVASRVWGIVSPSALAVLRLITSWNLVGCSIGRSAGFVPLGFYRHSSRLCGTCLARSVHRTSIRRVERTP